MAIVDFNKYSIGGSGGGSGSDSNAVKYTEQSLSDVQKEQARANLSAEESVTREYDSQSPNGMGYLVLKKDATFASQVTDTNTIYEIRYAFDLNNTSVTIPSGCVLKFNGGLLSNGTINGNQTKIDADLVKIFDSITLAGTFSITESFPEWYGATGNNVSDDTTALQQCVTNAQNIKVLAVRLRSNGVYKISQPITAKRMKIYSSGEKYGQYGSTLSATANFSSTTIDGLECKSILLPQEPSEISGIYFNCNKVCNAIQFTSWAGGYIRNCGFVNFICGIVAKSAELVLIEDNYFVLGGIGIRIASVPLNINGNIYRPQSSALPGGHPYMVYVRGNMIQGCNMGIYCEKVGSLSILQNSTAHCQMFGIYLDSCKSVSISKCYTEGDGVCVSDIPVEGMVSGVQPAVDTSESLISKNLDGYSINNVMYRGIYCAVNCENVDVSDIYCSYKKRGQITTPDSFNYDREDAGVDALVINYRSMGVKISNIFPYDWNANALSGVTPKFMSIYAMLANYETLHSFDIDGSILLPFKFITTNGYGSGIIISPDAISTKVNRTYPLTLNSVVGFSKKTYGTVFDQMPTSFNKAFDEMNLTFVQYYEGVSLYKATDQVVLRKWFDPQLLLDGNYEICVFEKIIDNTVSQYLSLSVTFWASGSNVGSWGNGTATKARYNYPIFLNRLPIISVPQGATRALVTLGLSSVFSQAVADNFLFSAPFIRKIGDESAPDLDGYEKSS